MFQIAVKEFKEYHTIISSVSNLQAGNDSFCLVLLADIEVFFLIFMTIINKHCCTQSLNFEQPGSMLDTQWNWNGTKFLISKNCGRSPFVLLLQYTDKTACNIQSCSKLHVTFKVAATWMLLTYRTAVAFSSNQESGKLSKHGCWYFFVCFFVYM